MLPKILTVRKRLVATGDKSSRNLILTFCNWHIHLILVVSVTYRERDSRAWIALKRDIIYPASRIELASGVHVIDK